MKALHSFPGARPASLRGRHVLGSVLAALAWGCTPVAPETSDAGTAWDAMATTLPQPDASVEDTTGLTDSGQDGAEALLDESDLAAGPRPLDAEFYAEGLLPPQLERFHELTELPDEVVRNARGVAEIPIADEASIPERVRRQLATQTKHVIGAADTRVPISSTAVTPFSSIVFIKSFFPKTPAGTFSICSGTLIARDAVLTAAHCVHNDKEGGRVSSVQVIPGMYGSGGKQTELSGVGSTWAKGVFYPSSYRDPSGYQYDLIRYDYAVIRLKTNIGDKAGFRKYGTLTSPLDRFAQLISYHGDLCPSKRPICYVSDTYTMHQSNDRVRKVIDNVIFNHYIDMVPGASGGGVTTDGAEYNMVFGVNVAQAGTATHNMGVLINSSIYWSLKDWVGRVL